VVRYAEGAGDFAKFLKERPKKKKKEYLLSPEEYAMALEAEMMSQRKKYYINGQIKPNNLVVPWRVVSEKQIETDSRRVLKKNGIFDPDGRDEAAEDTAEQEAEEEGIKVKVYSGTVLISWKCGDPAGKIGYIVERKRVQDPNFFELSTYENQKNPALQIREEGEGTEYDYEDEAPPSGKYTYRVLVRESGGEIKVVDTQTVEVMKKDNTSALTAIIFLGIAFTVTIAVSSLIDPPATYN